MEWLLAIAGVLGMAAAYAVLAAPRAAKQARRRLQAVRLRHSDAPTDKVEAQYRRAVAAQKPTLHLAGGGRLDMLALRLRQTGKGWTLRQYLSVSSGVTLAVTLIVLVQTGAALVSLGIGLLVGVGVPYVVVGRFIGKRRDAFTARFPDAIELLVRGLRSGLPVTETLGIVASEIPGPVGEEFRQVTERMRIGRPFEDALQDAADRLATPEFSFFVIALAIQRETGGNLAETLSNLADVLRKRAQMKLKIKAMSSESKASAYIVGALPFVVLIMIWWVNPEYISAFASDDRLTVAGIVGFVWMGIGAFIMAKMVSFEI